MKQKWIPSHEPLNWLDLETTIISRSPSPKFEMCIFEKAIVPKKSISKAMTFHLLKHIKNQFEAKGDARLESDRYGRK